MVFVPLVLSIILSTGRNVFSKKISDIAFGTRLFFVCQSILFLGGGAAVAVSGAVSLRELSVFTVGYAVAYAVLLILAQWFYTAALSTGNTSLCSTVYSLGFVLPTVSGAVVWNEPFSLFDFCGVLCAVCAVVVTGLKPKTVEEGKKKTDFIPLVTAMIASGGLGVVQKLQQKSQYAEQRSMFLFIAFSIAAGISALFALISKKQGGTGLKRETAVDASCIGVFFGVCNLLNTYLAGRLDSKVFFPTLNCGTILFSSICGVVMFKEKMSKRDFAVLILGGAAILLLNLGF